MTQSTQHLIIGATGKTGTRVLENLREKGFSAKGASRQGDVHFDWNDEKTWASALNGVDSVYLTYYPDLAIPKAPEDISRFCALAKIRGVSHITLLSGRGEPAAQVCENIVKQSGLSWTVVRASWFNQNFSEGMFRDYILNGRIALPVDHMPEPFVDIDDIAEIVVESLTDDKHNGQLYEVTGPELLSFKAVADTFSRVLNKPVVFEQISLEAFQQGLESAGADKGAIEALTYLFTEVLDGRNAHTCEGIPQALGRPAKSFDDFVRDNAHWFEGVKK
ncbi:NmrA family transcriptional regulator [Alteromonas sediminis]|uniref:NmrA family transcriptional regulator n=1 Tax=Alteromonas sediminis TaxID=2259342 RepID=A0A3N5Y076_9ALTE|nr:NmrA family NAD(P)-binding protein [Alteromonas sediminis]RPJ65836.1 NmrA family transcriptional regulator [Alteromonas sediminis]